MWFALESGRLSAEVLAEVLAKGDPTRDALALYEQMWQAEFGHELYAHLKWTKLFYKIPTRIVRMAARDKQLVKRSADALTGNRVRGSGRRWTRMRVSINAVRYSFRRTPRDLPIPGHPGPAMPLT
jgi:flavin-dependent dehydrogenase